MTEEEIPTEYHDENYDLPSEPSPARPVSPLSFFGPSVDPVENRDYRPTAITLTDAELDQIREDGHGNFTSSEIRTMPVHPSAPRNPKPYETNVDDDEESEETTEE